jgi:hypothetical protein
MMDIILSTPEVYFYLVIVAVLFVAALWTRPTDPRAAQPRATIPAIGREPATPRWQHAATTTVPPGGVAARSPGADARPFSDFNAALSASDAGKLEKAVTTIRIGLPTGASPTDRAAG